MAVYSSSFYASTPERAEIELENKVLAGTTAAAAHHHTLATGGVWIRVDLTDFGQELDEWLEQGFNEN